jgi:hypothetical protein
MAGLVNSERLLAVALKEFKLVPRKDARTATTILLRMVNNLEKDLTMDEAIKYRYVSIQNKVITNQLLSVRGARTALRGIGFVIDEDTGEYYEYNDSELGRSAMFLQAFLDDLDRRDIEEGPEEDLGKNFVRRQGPSTEEGFKRYATGIEGLQSRWAELQFVLRDPISNESSFIEIKKGVGAAQAFLILLESTAKEVDLLQGVIMQSISGDGAGHGGTASEMEGKVEESKIAELRTGMYAIRSLLRLKITDDADLDTARRSVLDVGQFFTLLAKECIKKGNTEFELLKHLDLAHYAAPEGM